jgi:hypothetical protein
MPQHADADVQLMTPAAQLQRGSRTFSHEPFIIKKVESRTKHKSHRTKCSKEGCEPYHTRSQRDRAWEADPPAAQGGERGMRGVGGHGPGPGLTARSREFAARISHTPCLSPPSTGLPETRRPARSGRALGATVRVREFEHGWF